MGMYTCVYTFFICTHNTHAHTYIYTYIFVCVCVCICVCVCVCVWVSVRISTPIVKEASFRTSNSNRLYVSMHLFIHSCISVLILALSFSSTENFRWEYFRNLQIISEPLSLSFSIWKSIGIPFWKIPDQEPLCLLYTWNLIVCSNLLYIAVLIHEA